MSVELEWQIDQDESEGPWEPTPPPRRPQQAPAPRPTLGPKARIALALLLVPLVACTGIALLLTLSRTRDAQAAAVLALARREDEVIAAGDFAELLAQQDTYYAGWPLWWETANSSRDDTLSRDAQVDAYWSYRVTSERLAAGPAVYGRVELNALGDRARLVVTRQFALPSLQIASPPVLAVRVTQYYRAANGRWVHTGPPRGEAAAMRSLASARFSLRYPAADAAVIEPLFPALEALAAHACADMGCPDAAPELIVSASPEDLMAYAVSRPQRDRVVVYAPAPLLAGTLIGAEGDRELIRLYGVRLVTGIASAAAGTRTGAMRSWLHWELNRLGLLDSLPRTVLAAAARRALSDGLNPLKTRGLRYAGVWMGLDFLAATPDRHPLREVISSGYSINASSRIDMLVGQRPDDWQAYLSTVAAGQVRNYARPP